MISRVVYIAVLLRCLHFPYGLVSYNKPFIYTVYCQFRRFSYGLFTAVSCLQNTLLSFSADTIRHCYSALYLRLIASRDLKCNLKGRSFLIVLKTDFILLS